MANAQKAVHRIDEQLASVRRRNDRRIGHSCCGAVGVETNFDCH